MHTGWAATMDVTLEHVIAAIITTRRDRAGGGAPIFFADDEEDLHRTAVYLAKILDGVVHDLGGSTLIVVKH
ncbi:MAG: capping complex subunit for YIEGIA [Clostridia bacterium]